MTSLVLAFLVAQATSTAIVFPPEQVRIVKAADQEKCKFIKQETCKSSRGNGIARCEKWHKIRAGRAGANQVEIITQGSDSRVGSIQGAIYTTSHSSVTADYYYCPIP